MKAIHEDSVYVLMVLYIMIELTGEDRMYVHASRSYKDLRWFD